MSGSLTQEQIDALKNSAGLGDDTPPEETPAQPPEAATEAAGGEATAEASAQPPATGGEPELDSADIDILGEVYNISMGAAATAVSSLLRMKVDITTPRVEVIDAEDFVCTTLEPGLGVEINYVQGILGSNIFVLNKTDIMRIVDILLGGTGNDVEGEFSEMHESAIGEVMNQMMGASATALAGFFGEEINISTPRTYSIEGQFQLDPNAMPPGTRVASTTFNLVVGDVFKTEMISAAPLQFALDMVGKAKRAFGMVMEQPAAEPALTDPLAGSGPPQPAPEPAPAPAPEPPPAPAPQPAPPAPAPAPMPAPAPSPQVHQNVNVQPVQLHSFDNTFDSSAVHVENLDLILDLPLEVTVEIGRTKRPVQEILDIGEGSIIELDKQAADPVDIIVNGHLIARGDVVVIDENFGVRITEIVSGQERMKATK